MKQNRSLTFIAVCVVLSACGTQGPSDQGANSADVSNAADLNAVANEAMAAADAALADAGAALEKYEKADAEPAPTPTTSMPSYSSASYCQKIGETSGGSSVIERSCRDMEDEALTAIRARSIPARVHRYCDNIGQTAGGSYVIYNSCVDMELEAAGTL